MRLNFLQRNRRRLAQTLPGSVVVLCAYTALQRSNDTAFTFEQEANFWYLTGIESAGWWLVIDTKEQKSWLVAPDVDDLHQVFDGSLSKDEAKQMSGVDDVLSRADGEALLVVLAKKYETAYTLGTDPHAKRYGFALNPAQKAMQKQLKGIFSTVRDCRLELAKLRATKQPQEVTAIEKAIALTVGVFKEVKKTLPGFTYEYQIEAEFSYRFRNSGAKGHAYDPIVAGGNNACTLHYTRNQDRLPENGLVLLDIGARIDGYMADITRTYAVGIPTERQREVHGAVESAHKEIISLLKPGLDVTEYQVKVDEIMKQKLTELGLLKRPEDYRKYFPHAISHGLGVDVHDSLGRPTEFLPGMVLTVEPGIYIPEEGIGVRIEDDILITKDGHENLSGALPTSL